MFQILTEEYADTVRGWSGSNPYGMVRLTLTEHVALAWASEAGEYHSSEFGGEWCAIVDLSREDLAFWELAEHLDAAHLTTPDHPYPYGTWSYDGPDGTSSYDGDAGPWSLIVYVDDRGWPTAEVVESPAAHEHFDGLASHYYGDDDDE